MSVGKVKATTVHDVEAEASAIFIDTLDANNSEPWYDTITVDGVDIRFKLDSGADVTCIPASVYVKLMRPRDLQKTNRLLYGANNSPLTVMGIFTAHLAWRQNVCTTEVYIINDLRMPLLSRGACQALRLIIRAEEVTAIPDNTFVICGYCRMKCKKLKRHGTRIAFAPVQEHGVQQAYPMNYIFCPGSVLLTVKSE
jgi:hypothetical protein